MAQPLFMPVGATFGLETRFELFLKGFPEMDLGEQENLPRTLIGNNLVRSLDLLQGMPILYLEV